VVKKGGVVWCGVVKAKLELVHVAQPTITVHFLASCYIIA
jgi:hypothetical protein